jgi:hypothetical protein
VDRTGFKGEKVKYGNRFGEEFRGAISDLEVAVAALQMVKSSKRCKISTKFRHENLIPHLEKCADKAVSAIKAIPKFGVAKNLEWDDFPYLLDVPPVEEENPESEMENELRRKMYGYVTDPSFLVEPSQIPKRVSLGLPDTIIPQSWRLVIDCAQAARNPFHPAMFKIMNPKDPVKVYKESMNGKLAPLSLFTIPSREEQEEYEVACEFAEFLEKWNLDNLQPFRKTE